MKKFTHNWVSAVVLSILIGGTVSAQSVAINGTGAAANASAMLDMTTTAKGLLVPRVTGAERLAIPTPTANSLLVYQTNGAQKGFWYYDLTLPAWVRLFDSDGWKTGGDAGTNVNTNWVGTNDPAGFAFRTDNTERMRFTVPGLLGINEVAPAEIVDVAGAMKINGGATPNLSTNPGVIRWENTESYHQGRTTSGGWEKIENAFQDVINQPYEGFITQCGPGSAEVATENATSSGPTVTPFPTSNRNAKVQYYFTLAELTSFGLCAGQIEAIWFNVADGEQDFSLQPQVRMMNANLGGAGITGYNAALSAQPNIYSGAGTIQAVSGWLQLPTIGGAGHTWNATTGIMVEVCWLGNCTNAPCTDVTVAMTTGLGYNGTWYGYDAFPNSGCAMTNVTPGSATRGTSTSRPVIRFEGQAVGPQPALQFNDYNLYTGGLMIGPAGWAATNYKGNGVIAAQNGVYDGTIQLSDYVFDKYFDGEVLEEDQAKHGDFEMYSLDEMGAFIEKERHLPTIAGRDAWDQQGGFSLGELGTQLWVTAETQALYILQLKEDLEILEKMAFQEEEMSKKELNELLNTIDNNPRLEQAQKERLKNSLLESFSKASAE